MCQHNLPCSIVYAHCLLPGRAFASLYVLHYLEKEAEIGGRAVYKALFSVCKKLNFFSIGNVNISFCDSYHFVSIVELLLQQALVGTHPNSLILTYVKHAIFSQVSCLYNCERGSTEVQVVECLTPGSGW